MEQIWHYISHHWFQLTVDALATLNVIAAGTRVMGWTWVSDECGKVEQAITAMVQAALNRGQIQQNLKTTDTTTESPKTGV